jgi:hypothetical protein
MLLFIWLNLYPLYILLLYFAKKGFLSFDLLTGGLLGMNSMLTWTAGMLLLLAIYLWSFPILLVYHLAVVRPAKRNQQGGDVVKKVPTALWWLTLPLSLLMFVAVGVAANASKAGWPLALGLLVFTFAIAGCAALFVRRTWADSLVNWQAPTFLLLISMVVPALAHDATAHVVDVSLRHFRLGGGLDAQIYMAGAPSHEKPIAQGKLLLASVENIYLEVINASQTTLVTFANTQNIRLEVGKQ